VASQRQAGPQDQDAIRYGLQLRGAISRQAAENALANVPADASGRWRVDRDLRPTLTLGVSRQHRPSAPHQAAAPCRLRRWVDEPKARSRRHRGDERRRGAGAAGMMAVGLASCARMPRMRISKAASIKARPGLGRISGAANCPGMVTTADWARTPFAPMSRKRLSSLPVTGGQIIRHLAAIAGRQSQRRTTCVSRHLYSLLRCQLAS
jgi:hypothetical protein